MMIWFKGLLDLKGELWSRNYKFQCRVQLAHDLARGAKLSMYRFERVLISYVLQRHRLEPRHKRYFGVESCSRRLKGLNSLHPSHKRFNEDRLTIVKQNGPIVPRGTMKTSIPSWGIWNVFLKQTNENMRLVMKAMRQAKNTSRDSISRANNR